MRRALFVAAVACIAMAPIPAHAETVVLKPASAWNVDFAPDKCQLIRTFGEGANAHFLRFQQYAPSQAAGLTVAGPEFKRFRSLMVTDLRFYEGQTAHRTKPFTGTVDQFGPGVIYSYVTIDGGMPERPPENAPPVPVGAMLDPALGKMVQFVELRQGDRTVRLDTGPLNAAFEVLNQCTFDLLRDWGLDPEKHKTAQSDPVWTNKDVIVRRIMADYPDDAWMEGEQAILRMRVIISETGAVESCTMLQATKAKTLESPACRLMKNATFEPARDANGAAFKSYYTTSLTYRMR